MPPNNSTGAGPGVAGRAPPTPPQRTATFSSLYRRATGKSEKEPEIQTKEVFISKYELDWDRLKEWLDTRFAQYNRTFTERFQVSRDHYVVYLPEDLTEEDEVEIALLKTPRSTT